MNNDIEQVLYSQEEVNQRIDELAATLTAKYQGEFPEELSARLQRAAEAAFKLDNEMSEIREEIQEAQTMFSNRTPGDQNIPDR